MLPGPGRNGAVTKKVSRIMGAFKWMLVLAIVYLLTYCVVIALEKDLGLVEPVAMKVRIKQQVESYFEPKKLPKKHFTPGSADLNGLVNSKMFVEQGSKLAWIKKRLLSMRISWEVAAMILLERHPEVFEHPKSVLLFPGLLTEYSAYNFAEMAFKGGFLGELVQWSDLIAVLYMLGHEVVISTSVPHLRKQVAAAEHPFDVMITDYIGLWGIRDADLFGFYKCRIRVLDSFGTDPSSNFRTKTYIPPHSDEEFANWNFEDSRQFWTLYPHSPDNSFLGFAMEKPVVTYTGLRKNQAIIYGKEAYYIYGMESFLDTIGEYMEVHSTFKGDVSKIPNHIVNHGVLSQPDLRYLLQSSKLFIGVGFPFEGPGAIEAIANGCVYIQPRFPKPISRSNHGFFHNKPTNRELSSQNPYLEKYVGEPHVYTVDPKNETAVREVVRTVLSMTNLSSFLPYEFSQKGMLERIGFYILHQNFCDGENIAIGKKATASSHFSDHSAQQAIDGVVTSETCYWSEPSVSSWWELDLGVDVAISKIRITNTFEWIVAKSWDVFIVPFEISLLNSLGKTVNSKTFKDESLFYLWEGIHNRARYIRIDTLQYTEPRYLVLCNVEVFGSNQTKTVIWPHPSLLVIEHSKPGQSCVEACSAKRMACEHGYFPLINNAKVLFDKSNCSDFKKINDKYLDMLPAAVTLRDKDNKYPAGMCLSTDISMLFSCVGKREGYQRLCPCRHYRTDQVALPIQK